MPHVNIAALEYRAQRQCALQGPDNFIPVLICAGTEQLNHSNIVVQINGDTWQTIRLSCNQPAGIRAGSRHDLLTQLPCRLDSATEKRIIDTLVFIEGPNPHADL